LAFASLFFLTLLLADRFPLDHKEKNLHKQFLNKILSQYEAETEFAAS